MFFVLLVFQPFVLLIEEEVLFMCDAINAHGFDAVVTKADALLVLFDIS